MDPYNYDTRTGLGSGSLGLGGVGEGEYKFTFQTNIFPTGCHFQTDSGITESHLNSVTCLPTWNFDMYGNIGRFPQDGAPIIIGYTASLDAVARPAIDEWQNKLSRAGLNLQLTPAPGVGCAVVDAHCITIDSMTCPDPFANACGCTSPPSGPDGLYGNRSIIHLRPGFGSWPAEAQTSVIAHEMGHLFGLAHQQNCSETSTVMHTLDELGLPCGSVPQATRPTNSDAVPVAKTVYSNGSRKVCSGV